MRRNGVCDTILKELAVVGGFNNENSLAVIAYIIEAVITRPELELNDIMSEFAKRHGATRAAVERIIDRNFNVYDEEIFNRITAYTNTKPLTAKDAFFDLAGTIKLKFYPKKQELSEIFKK